MADTTNNEIPPLSEWPLWHLRGLYDEFCGYFDDKEMENYDRDNCCETTEDSITSIIQAIYDCLENEDEYTEEIYKTGQSLCFSLHALRRAAQVYNHNEEKYLTIRKEMDPQFENFVEACRKCINKT